MEILFCFVFDDTHRSVYDTHSSMYYTHSSMYNIHSSMYDTHSIVWYVFKYDSVCTNTYAVKASEIETSTSMQGPKEIEVICFGE